MFTIVVLVMLPHSLLTCGMVKLHILECPTTPFLHSNLHSNITLFQPPFQHTVQKSFPNLYMRASDCGFIPFEWNSNVASYIAKYISMHICNTIQYSKLDYSIYNTT